jgi:hypothetical protein
MGGASVVEYLAVGEKGPRDIEGELKLTPKERIERNPTSRESMVS